MVHGRKKGEHAMNPTPSLEQVLIALFMLPYRTDRFPQAIARQAHMNVTPCTNVLDNLVAMGILIVEQATDQDTPAYLYGKEPGYSGRRPSRYFSFSAQGRERARRMLERARRDHLRPDVAIDTAVRQV
jgi:hypothetical protein